VTDCIVKALGNAAEKVILFCVLFVSVWTPFITVTTLVLQYFPLFTAVEFPYPFFGYIAGLIYAIMW